MNISCWIVSSHLAHSFKVSLDGTQVPLTGNSIGIGSSGPLVDQPEFYAGQNSQENLRSSTLLFSGLFAPGLFNEMQASF